MICRCCKKIPNQRDLNLIFFSPGYNAPYLSLYSENAVDVFDVNTMEWIQTIPLKKVSGAASLPPPAGSN